LERWVPGVEIGPAARQRLGVGEATPDQHVRWGVGAALRELGRSHNEPLPLWVVDEQRGGSSANASEPCAFNGAPTASAAAASCAARGGAQ